MNKTYKTILLLTLPFLFYLSIYTRNDLSLIIFGIILYALFDYRLPLLFLPLVFFPIPIILKALLIIGIGSSLILRKFVVLTKSRVLIYDLLLMITNVLISYFYLEIEIRVLLLTNLASFALLFGLLQTVNFFHLENESVTKVSNFPLFNGIISASILFSVFTFDPLVVLVLGIILILYLSFLDYKAIGLIFSIFAFFLCYQMEYSYLFLLIGLIYQTKRFFPYLLSIGLLAIGIFLFPLLPLETSFFILLILSLFELFKRGSKSVLYFQKRTSILNMYDNVINNFNDQVLKFASFLDEFERKFVTNREVKIKFNESYSHMLNTFCGNCERKQICLGQKKQETYNYFKNALLYGKNLRVKRDSSLSLSFINNCLHNDEIINLANVMKNKYNFNKEKSQAEQTIQNSIVEVSKTLRQYVVDISSKREMHLELFLRFKNRLTEQNYQIMLFNVRRIFKNDFWIEVGLNGIHKEELDLVKNEAELLFQTKVSIEIKKEIEDTIYFSIIPLINYNILYGHGSISKEGYNITGDNYMIKDLDTGMFICAISDGMGSGYRAYTESKETLDLIDKNTEFEVNPETSINMLNTFYSLKENMDQYATLDFLEINRSNGDGILFKMGSSNTYLVRNKEIVTIYNENLPFGINDLITKDTLKVETNDCIILASDGINDNISENDFREQVFLSLHKNPQKIAYDILNRIINHSTSIKDDMSIVVLKVEKVSA